MARRPNPYNGDPNLRAGFDNIAAMFAPPSGSDLAGYAAAGLNNQKRQQLAEYYKMASDPNASRDVVDRYGVATGVFSPTQSYHKIDVDSADTRRGQDITAGTARDNNLRDNARAMAATRYGDIKEGDIRPAMPASVASMFGLPEQPEQRGTVKLSQNQTATLPDGSTMTGINRPQTMDEWQAQNLERQRQAGTLSDQQITDIAMGKQSPVTVMGPDGKTPVYAAPGTAMRMQMPAAAAPSSTPVNRSEGTAVINGQMVPVTRAPDGLRWQLQDGSPVPDGAQVQNMLSPQSTKDAQPTEASDKAGIFYSRAAPASANMDAALKGGYAPNDLDYEAMLGAASGAPNAVTRHVISDKGRQFYGDAQNFMMSVLRPDTGAAFGKEEFQSYGRVFIPMPGDPPEVLRDKSIARQTALAALQGTSRGSAEAISKILSAQGLPIPPEMAAVIARGGVSRGSPAVPGRAMAPTPGEHSSKLTEARDAIQRGAPRDAVIDRLRGMGIDPGGL